MYICIYVNMHTYTYMYTHTHTDIHTHIRTHIPMGAYTHLHRRHTPTFPHYTQTLSHHTFKLKFAQIHTCAHICTHAHTDTCSHIHIRTSIAHTQEASAGYSSTISCFACSITFDTHIQKHAVTILSTYSNLRSQHHRQSVQGRWQE